MKDYALQESVSQGSACEVAFEVTRPLVENFAALVGDFSSLHLDQDFGRRSIYRKNVVHGMLPLTFIGALNMARSREYTSSLRKISAKFLKPVFLNDRLLLASKLIGVDKENDEHSFEYVIQNSASAAVLTSGFFTLEYREPWRSGTDVQHARNGDPKISGLVDGLAESDLKLEDIHKGQEAGFQFTIGPEHEYWFYDLLSMGLAEKNRMQFQDWAVGCDSRNLLAASLFSTFVGMSIPGRNGMFLEFAAEFDGLVERGKKYLFKGQVGFKSTSTGTVVINTAIGEPYDSGRPYASGKITARVNERPVKMPALELLRATAIDLELRDKVVLITGASRGIGETTAKLFSLHGSKVVVNYFRGIDDANKIVEEIRSHGGTALAIQADVSQRSQVKEMVETVGREYGRIDVLVNNAVRNAQPIDFMELPWDEVEKDIAVNVKGAFNCCQEIIPWMVKHRGGKIINLSTVAIDMPLPGQAKYVIAKSALVGLSRTLAVEFAPFNIQVNIVEPGFVETDLTQHVSRLFVEGLKNDTPLKRNASPLDVAKAVVFLASSLASFTTGQKLMVTGGNAPFL